MLLGLRNAHSTHHNGKKGPEKGICVIIQRDTTEIAIDTFHNRQVLVTFIFFLDSLCFWRFSCRLVFVKTVSPVFPYITYWSYGIFFRSFSYGCTWETCLVYSRVPSFHRHNDTVIYQHIPKHHTKTPNINMCGLSGILLPMCLPIFSLGRLSSLGFFFVLFVCSSFPFNIRGKKTLPKPEAQKKSQEPKSL